MCLCLSREVIVLLLLSCCDGINDQDKTVILLPLSSLHHISQRKEFIVSSIEKESRSFQYWVDKTQDGWGNEWNWLSELFQRNKRVRAIFFYYLDIIQWSNTLPLDQKSSQASSKTHSSPYIWINTGSGLRGSWMWAKEKTTHSHLTDYKLGMKIPA